MDIRSYLAAKQLSQDQFAKLAGVSQGLVWQWLNGRTTITAERAIALEKVTAGEVTRYDLRPDIFGEAPAQPRTEAAA